jgi:DNA-3-methyladenine glycosylase II
MKAPARALPATQDPTQQAAAVAHLQAVDPVLARIIAAVGPPNIRYDPNYFAGLVGAIMGHQISVAAASAIRARLAARFTAERPLSPEGLLALAEDDLRAIGLSRAKMVYVADLATKVASRVVDLATIGQLPDEAVIEQLTRVKGIGRWSAEMFLIFSLGRPDVLPVDDLAIRSAARRQYDLPVLPRAVELHALAEPWRPYRTFGSWYLWRSRGGDPRVGLPASPNAADTQARS